MDLDVRGRGVAKSEVLGGRKPGTKRSYEKTHKPLAAPTLRRDPTACDRLHIISEREQRAKGDLNDEKYSAKIQENGTSGSVATFYTGCRWVALRLALRSHQRPCQGIIPPRR